MPPPFSYSDMRGKIEIQAEEIKDLKALLAQAQGGLSQAQEGWGEEKEKKKSAKKKLKKTKKKLKASEKETNRLKIISYIPLSWVFQWLLLCWDELLMPFGLWLWSIGSRFVDWLCSKMVDLWDRINKRSERHRVRVEKEQEDVYL